MVANDIVALLTVVTTTKWKFVQIHFGWYTCKIILKTWQKSKSNILYEMNLEKELQNRNLDYWLWLNKCEDLVS